METDNAVCVAGGATDSARSEMERNVPRSAFRSHVETFRSEGDL